MNVMTLQSPERTPEDVLEMLDAIRRRAQSGEVIGFTAVTLEAGDATSYYTATAGPISRLRTMGAIYALMSWFIAGGGS